MLNAVIMLYPRWMDCLIKIPVPGMGNLPYSHWSAESPRSWKPKRLLHLLWSSPRTWKYDPTHEDNTHFRHRIWRDWAGTDHKTSSQRTVSHSMGRRYVSSQERKASTCLTPLKTHGPQQLAQQCVPNGTTVALLSWSSTNNCLIGPKAQSVGGNSCLLLQT